MKDARHRQQQTAYEKYAMDQKQRPQPFVGIASRTNRQTRKERCKRHQRITQQIEAEKEVHLLKIQQFLRLLRQAAEAHCGELREVDQQNDGRVNAGKCDGGIPCGLALRYSEMQEATYHRDKAERNEHGAKVTAKVKMQ